MKKLILITAAVMLTVNGFGQAPNWAWARQGTGDTLTNVEGRSVANDLFGNSYFTGSFQDTVTFGSTILIPQNVGSNANNYLVKYNSSGSVVWARSFGGFGCYAQTDALGNIYVAGTTADGVGTITIGSFIITSMGDFDVFLAKFDSSGTVLWVKTGGGTGSDNIPGGGIATDIFGNVYIAGFFDSPTIWFGTSSLTNTNGSSYDKMFIAKYNSSGDLLWLKGSTGFFDGIFEGMATDNIGNIYLTSSFYSSSINFGSTSVSLIGSTDLFLIKLDSSGNEVWLKSIGSGGLGSYGISVITNSSKDVYVTGSVNSSNSSYCSTIKFDSLGNLRWIKNSTRNYRATGYGIALDACENIYISGDMYDDSISFGTINLAPVTTGEDNMFLVKYDSSGTALWGEVLGGGGDDINAISMENNGNLFVAGDFIPSYFVIGNDTLTNIGGEYPFIAKLYAPCFVGEGIKELPNPETITLYPNPTTSSFTISTTAGKIKEIKVFDVVGEIVNSQQGIGNSQCTIDMKGVAKGIYFVQIMDEKGNVVNKKVVVE